jgi:hypothetical protein
MVKPPLELVAVAEYRPRKRAALTQVWLRSVSSFLGFACDSQTSLHPLP